MNHRPLYEQPKDLNHEQVFKDRMLEKYGVTLNKAPISYKVDFFAWKDNGEFAGIIEYKRRNMAWGQYPTIMLSALKLHGMLSLVRELGGVAHFVVETNDGTYTCKDFTDLKIVYGGRTLNTRDSADIEPIAEIPIERFTKIFEANV